MAKGKADQKKHRVLIAEDQTIFREVLRELLASDPNIEVVGEVSDGFEAIRGAARLKPDMVLLDLSMPRMNGLDALREIRRVSKDVQILVLTSYEDEDHIRNAFEAGARAYIVKDVSFRELLFAIREVVKGKIYISPAVCGAIVHEYLRDRPVVSPEQMLTDRERNFLDLLSRNWTEEDFARHFSIQIDTVKRMRRNIMRKLQVTTREGLLAYAGQMKEKPLALAPSPLPGNRRSRSKAENQGQTR